VGRKWIFPSCDAGIPLLAGMLSVAGRASCGSMLVAAANVETFSATEVGANCGAAVGGAAG
jgi:hypothetical protein